MSSASDDDEREADAKTVSMQVRVSTSANTLLVALAKDHGVTNKGVVGRLLTWFAAQEPSVRSAILYPGGDPSAELARLRLAQMAAAGEGIDTLGKTPMSVDDAVRLMHSLLDYVQQVSRGMAAVARESLKEPAAKKKG